ncbi:ATP-binding protein [Variovorax sp. J22R115]|uniref:sensor histidine kinase n=1 Tax=Variovorax sp. J22R115 TaxID=3053509 RepID=UPI0030152B55
MRAAPLILCAHAAASCNASDCCFAEGASVSKTGPRTQGGTGLGLPVVQRICARMNGKISVDSKPGHGTRALSRTATGLLRSLNSPQTRQGRYAGRHDSQDAARGLSHDDRRH